MSQPQPESSASMPTSASLSSSQPSSSTTPKTTTTATTTTETATTPSTLLSLSQRLNNNTKNGSTTASGGSLSFWSRASSSSTSSTPISAPNFKWQLNKRKISNNDTTTPTTNNSNSNTTNDNTTLTLLQKLSNLRNQSTNTNKSNSQPISLEKKEKEKEKEKEIENEKEKEKDASNVACDGDSDNVCLTQPDDYTNPNIGRELVDDLDCNGTSNSYALNIVDFDLNDEEDVSRPLPPPKKSKSEIAAAKSAAKNSPLSKARSKSSLASNQSASTSTSTTASTSSQSTPTKSRSRSKLNKSAEQQADNNTNTSTISANSKKSKVEQTKTTNKNTSKNSKSKSKGKGKGKRKNEDEGEDESSSQYQSVTSRILAAKSKRALSSSASSYDSFEDDADGDTEDENYKSSQQQVDEISFDSEESELCRSLQSDQPKVVLKALLGISSRLGSDTHATSLSLRSLNLMPSLNNALLGLTSNYANSIESTGNDSHNNNDTNSNGGSNTISLLNSEDLFQQFLSVSSSTSTSNSTSSLSSSQHSSPVSLSKRGSVGVRRSSSYGSIKDGDSDSGSDAASGNSDNESSLVVSPFKRNQQQAIKWCKFSPQEFRDVNLSTCFIYYVLSSQHSNIDHFTPEVLRYLLDQASIIPENYQLEYFTTPTKLPKSPKSPGGRRLNSTHCTATNNIFQNYVGDTARASSSTSSVAIMALSQLVSHKHFSNNLKNQYRELGVLDGLVKLLSRYTLYLNPLIETSSVSPKFIGSVERVLKIIEECVVEDKQNREYINTINSSLSIFITLISYIQNLMVKYKERLSGIDIRIGGTECILSILNLLLNVTHHNTLSSSIIGSLDSPYKYESKERIDIVDKVSDYIDNIFKNVNSNSNSNSNNSNNSMSNNGKPPLTPKKIMYLNQVACCKHFGIQTIINLLRIEVPEKFDIAQLSVTLLVNLVEHNPENRERFRSNQGAIESILNIYRWRTSDRVLTRLTSKTQEKVASSYLVILIGFLVKDNPTNRKIVDTMLPSDRSYLSMVGLLKDFIYFQGGNRILSKEIYKICDNLITDVFLQIPTTYESPSTKPESESESNPQESQAYASKTEIESTLKEYIEFKNKFEEKYKYGAHDQDEPNSDEEEEEDKKKTTTTTQPNK